MNAVVPLSAAQNAMLVFEPAPTVEATSAKPAFAYPKPATPYEDLFPGMYQDGDALIAALRAPIDLTSDFLKVLNPTNNPAHKISVQDFDADKGLSADVKFVAARKVGDYMMLSVLEQTAEGDYKSYYLKMSADAFEVNFKQFSDIGSKGSTAGWRVYLPASIANSAEMSHNPDKACRDFVDTLVVTKLSDDQFVKDFSYIAMRAVDETVHQNVLDKIYAGHYYENDKLATFLSRDFAEKRLAELDAAPVLKGTEQETQALQASLVKIGKDSQPFRWMKTDPFAPKAPFA